MSTPMSLDTILESLKQGNALELQFIKQLKDGLSFVVEGMQNECYNRSDALSSAIAKLEMERAKGHGHITAEQKATLTSIIKINILKCKSALTNNAKANEKIVASYVDSLKSARDRNSLALRKANEEKEGLNALADIVNGLRNAPAANVLRDVMSTWEERQDLLRREQHAMERNHEMEINMAKLCVDRERCVREEQMRIMKNIAQAAGVDEREVE